jgi:hypothetical protein
MDEVAGHQEPCRHHWVLGQPEAGQIKGVCRNCGDVRSYPAYFDDYDWSTENERRFHTLGVATAAGGARPSSVALLRDSES